MKTLRRLLTTMILLVVFGCFVFGCRPSRVPEEQPPAPTPVPTPALPSDCIVIDTKTKELTVIKGGAVTATFPRLAFGSGGVGEKRRRGDNVTPLGTFAIAWKNPVSKFRLFFGLNYPTTAYAERALHDNAISKKQFERIRAAQEKGEKPPQDTPLGGLIGIHGIGRGSLKIHHLIDWTDGCIALDNEQIDKLGALIHVGMPVIIR